MQDLAFSLSQDPETRGGRAPLLTLRPARALGKEEEKEKL